MYLIYSLDDGETEPANSLEEAKEMIKEWATHSDLADGEMREFEIYKRISTATATMDIQMEWEDDDDTQDERSQESAGDTQKQDVQNVELDDDKVEHEDTGPDDDAVIHG